MASWAWIFWSLAVLLGAGAAYASPCAAFCGTGARGRLRCPRCWFDMQVRLRAWCAPSAEHARGEAAQLGKTRRHYGHLAVAILLALGCYLNVRIPGVLASGDWEHKHPRAAARGHPPPL